MSRHAEREAKAEYMREYRARDPKPVRRARAVTRAREAAMLRVALNHPDEFAAAIAEEERLRRIPPATKAGRPRRVSA